MDMLEPDDTFFKDIAFENGEDSWYEGLDRDANPETRGDLKQAWFNGWDWADRENNWEGD